MVFLHDETTRGLSRRSTHGGKLSDSDAKSFPPSQRGFIFTDYHKTKTPMKKKSCSKFGSTVYGRDAGVCCLRLGRRGGHKRFLQTRFGDPGWPCDSPD